jgi:hypothetical protein
MGAGAGGFGASCGKAANVNSSSEQRSFMTISFLSGGE